MMPDMLKLVHRGCRLVERDVGPKARASEADSPRRNDVSCFTNTTFIVKVVSIHLPPLEWA